jgi:hypothetical protein
MTGVAKEARTRVWKSRNRTERKGHRGDLNGGLKKERNDSIITVTGTQPDTILNFPSITPTKYRADPLTVLHIILLWRIQLLARHGDSLGKGPTNDSCKQHQSG